MLQLIEGLPRDVPDRARAGVEPRGRGGDSAARVEGGGEVRDARRDAQGARGRGGPARDRFLWVHLCRDRPRRRAVLLLQAEPAHRGPGRLDVVHAVPEVVPLVVLSVHGLHPEPVRARRYPGGPARGRCGVPMANLAIGKCF